MIGRILENRLCVLTFALMGYSSAILLLAVLLGLATGDVYKGYLEKPNWFLFPLFWIPAVYLYGTTWSQFIASWKDLFGNGCIVNRDNGGVPTCWDAFVNQLNRYRRHILILSSVLAVVIMVLDTAELMTLYVDPPEHVYRLRVSTGDAETSTSWFLTKPEAGRGRQVKPIPLNELGTETGGEGKIDDASWTEAWLFKGGEEKGIGRSKGANLMFVCLAYGQQYIIIVMALASLLHIWAHLAFFIGFDNMAFARRHRVLLKLDPYSSIREFGLERWNQALNMIYWALSPALVIPIVSKASQSETGAGDTGQKMIQWLVPLLFLSPMLFTIIARQKKVMKLWAIIRQEEDRDKVEAYHKQLLWPLDKNWASKLGIIIAFSLLIFLVGDMLTEVGVDKLLK